MDRPREHSLDALRIALDGKMLVRRDGDYAHACQAWNQAWTHRPAAVIAAAHERDVITTVRHAAAHGYKVVVQSTGHGVTVPADEQSILITMAGLDHVTIDAVQRTATIGGGTAWNPVLEKAQEHGLAPLLGSAPHVGAIGYTLGGGFGWLARKHGLAVDSVTSLRIVLADGRAVTASQDENPDLFWAMCGAGGGSLGVVVEATIRLAPATDVYAGNLMYPIDQAREAFGFFQNWSARAPRELTSAFNITAFPPLDIVPEPLRGKAFAIVRGCFSGDLGEGQALIDEWRAWCAPAMDMFGPMPFARCAEISQDPVDPVPAASNGKWLSGIDEAVLDAMLGAVTGGPGPSPMLFAELRHGGGAISEPNSTVSYSGRDGAYSLEMVGLITGPDADAELDRRFSDTWKQLRGHLAERSGYLNFTEGQERIAAATSAFNRKTWNRLHAIKREHDPANVFSHGIDLARRRGLMGARR
ncbi:FAD-binding oxidoreductase [Lolliginicoccus suaedae]|uniref:FAD-binding oxidoreductase n=1 Tax=Lolliginicoccus suaedae TaxID=2605429 RepID=UPI001658EC3E|nr:FAD-binding oxidoreductase [Lolliginicoccus suaedae]